MKHIKKRFLSMLLAAAFLVVSVCSTYVPVLAEENEEPVYTWRETTAERDLYYDEFTQSLMGKHYVGETIEEILQMVEDPSITLELDTFFEGTALDGFTKEDLEWIKEEGWTLEDLISEASNAGAGSAAQYLSGISLFTTYAPVIEHFYKTSPKVTIPSLNNINKPFYYMEIGGYKAFCMDNGKHMYNGTTLNYDSSQTCSRGDNAIAYYYKYGSSISLAYEYAQMYVWVGNDKDTFITAIAELTYSLNHPDADVGEVESGGAALLNTGFYYTALGVYNTIKAIDTSKVKSYVYTVNNSNYQRLVCGYPPPTVPDEPTEPPETPSGAPDPTGSLTVSKVDKNTNTMTAQGNATLAGAAYDLYARNDIVNPDDGITVLFAAGTKISSVNLYGAPVTISGLYDGDYYLKETAAPNGYLVDAAEHDVTVSGESEISLPDEIMRGGVEIRKVDNDWGTGNAQGDASLAGAEYAIVNKSANAVYVDGTLYDSGSVVAKIYTDESGYASSGAILPYGSYSIYETSASTGYLVNASEHEFSIYSNGQTESFSSGEIREPVIRGGVKIQKFDIESGLSTPQGGATFANLVYEVVNRSAHPVFVNGQTYAVGAVVATMVTDENGYCELASNTLPYGTYQVTEVGVLDEEGQVVRIDELDALLKNGYIRYGILQRSFQIRANGQMYDLYSSANVGINNTVIRGDICFRKINADTQTAMEGVDFKITLYNHAGDPIESHIVTTDENGEFDSSSSYASHTAANGLWFGDAAPDDSRGALPYGTYSIEELQGPNNEGRNMYYDTFQITNKTNAIHLGYKVDLGNLENVMIGISTMAKCDDTGSQYAICQDNCILVDTVYYDHLTIGKEYTLKAYLADPDTGELLRDCDGEYYSGSSTWTAQLAGGHRDVEIIVDSRELAGKNVVIFEYLYINDFLLTKHNDPTDTDQMIYFCGIGTTAADYENGTHMSMADDKVVIVDTVKYTNVQPYRSYNMVGMLMDKKTGRQALDADGKFITATTTFTPNKPDGTVDVVFTFNGTDMEGKVLVAYETLERANSYHTILAIHEDIAEFSQTIYLPKISTQISKSTISTGNGKTTFLLYDTVYFDNVIPGMEYTISGVLMDKDTGKELLDSSGKKITAQTTFTPSVSSGSETVVFSFDGKGMFGKNVVVFEKLKVNGEVIAEHSDLTDENQSIYYVKPEIKTKADKSETKNEEGNTIVTVTDTVTYDRLVPGCEYTISGVLMDKESGLELLDLFGHKIVGETAFIPAEASGTAQVVFQFDATGLIGKDAVVFEELLINGDLVAEHKNLTDKEQTVVIGKVGIIRPHEGTFTSPKTGDREHPLLLFIAGIGNSRETVQAAENDESITKSTIYQTIDKSDQPMLFDQTILEDGKSYSLDSVDYEVIDCVVSEGDEKLTVSVVSDYQLAGNDYAPDETIEQDGITYHLISWKAKEESIIKHQVSGQTSYSHEISTATAPPTMSVDAVNPVTNETESYVCSIVSVENAGSTQYQKIDLTFENYDTADLYEWENGADEHRVIATDEAPLAGYEEQLLLEYGYDPEVYSVTKAVWRGEPYEKDGILCRDATATIRYYQPKYIAHYSGEYEYVQYEAVYQGAEPVTNYMIQATATYKPLAANITEIKSKTLHGVIAGLVIGWLLVIAVIAASVFYYRKNKSNQ